MAAPGTLKVPLFSCFSCRKPHFFHRFTPSDTFLFQGKSRVIKPPETLFGKTRRKPYFSAKRTAKTRLKKIFLETRKKVLINPEKL